MHAEKLRKLFGWEISQVEADVDSHGNLWYKGEIVGYSEADDSRLYAPDRDDDTDTSDAECDEVTDTVADTECVADEEHEETAEEEYSRLMSEYKTDCENIKILCESMHMSYLTSKWCEDVLNNSYYTAIRDSFCNYMSYDYDRGVCYNFNGTPSQIRHLLDANVRVFSVNKLLGFFSILGDIDTFPGIRLAYIDIHTGTKWFKTTDNLHLYEDGIEIIPYSHENSNIFNGTCHRYVINGINSQYVLYINNLKNYARLHILDGNTENQSLVVEADSISHTIGWITCCEDMTYETYHEYIQSLKEYRHKLDLLNYHLSQIYYDECFEDKTNPTYVCAVEEYEQSVLKITDEIAGYMKEEIEDLAILDFQERDILTKYDYYKDYYK